jgi:hypothetical protein
MIKNFLCGYIAGFIPMNLGLLVYININKLFNKSKNHIFVFPIIFTSIIGVICGYFLHKVIHNY